MILIVCLIRTVCHSSSGGAHRISLIAFIVLRSQSGYLRFVDQRVPLGDFAGDKNAHAFRRVEILLNAQIGKALLDRGRVDGGMHFFVQPVDDGAWRVGWRLEYARSLPGESGVAAWLDEIPKIPPIILMR